MRQPFDSRIVRSPVRVRIPCLLTGSGDFGGRRCLCFRGRTACRCAGRRCRRRVAIGSGRVHRRGLELTRPLGVASTVAVGTSRNVLSTVLPDRWVAGGGTAGRRVAATVLDTFVGWWRITRRRYLDLLFRLDGRRQEGVATHRLEDGPHVLRPRFVTRDEKHPLANRQNLNLPLNNAVGGAVGVQDVDRLGQLPGRKPFGVLRSPFYLAERIPFGHDLVDEVVVLVVRQPGVVLLGPLGVGPQPLGGLCGAVSFGETVTRAEPAELFVGWPAGSGADFAKRLCLCASRGNETAWL